MNTNQKNPSRTVFASDVHPGNTTLTMYQCLCCFCCSIPLCFSAGISFPPQKMLPTPTCGISTNFPWEMPPKPLKQSEYPFCSVLTFCETFHTDFCLGSMSQPPRDPSTGTNLLHMEPCTFLSSKGAD